MDTAVASNDPLAIIQVAISYLDDDGVPPDRNRAKALLQQAATMGSLEARELLKSYFPD